MAGTLNDIADSLNVSVSLVSKVLSGKLGTTVARQETIKAIQQRAREIGYVKNSSAAGLATGRQNVIGVYVHHHGVSGSGIAEAMIVGIAIESRNAHQRLVLTYFGSPAEFEAMADQMNRSQLDCMIVGGVGHPKLGPLLNRIRRSGVPVVTMCDTPMHPRIPNITVDQRSVCRVATVHLAERGCRNIAHIKVTDPRFEGYKLGLKEKGLQYRSPLVYEADFSYESGQRAVEHFAKQKIEIDGIVAQSDQQAVGALHTLLKMQKRVPEDVRIIGVDNSPFCQFSIVPLSSVSQEERLRGSIAVKCLLDFARGETPNIPQVEPLLVARDSTR
jgi:LacI family transcriptional regulator